MSQVHITLRVNGVSYSVQVHPWELLVDVLRERLRLTGTKKGCGQGECGACTLHVDGKAVLSCLMLAVQAEGKDVRTIEGLQQGERLSALQEAFIRESAVQCGYCTPGMIMAAHTLLESQPAPSEDMVRRHLSNNLCRCTGYSNAVKAVLAAARELRAEPNG